MIIGKAENQCFYKNKMFEAGETCIFPSKKEMNSNFEYVKDFVPPKSEGTEGSGKDAPKKNDKK